MTGDAGSGSPLAEGDDTTSPMSWSRAVLSAVVILAVGGALLVYVPNWALQHLTGLDRHGRTTITTGGFFALLLTLAWALRRLQMHRVV